MFEATKDPHDCFIAMNIQILKKKKSLINVYGSSMRDNPTFFNNVGECVEGIVNDYVIIASDWNLNIR